jgi:hypothetical protein
MKRLSLTALAVAVIMTACEKPIISDSDVTDKDGNPVEQVDATKKFTFTLKGDFSNEWKPVNHRTAGYLAADGKDMTDVWVLDYMGGELVQQLHQGDNTAEDFGQPSLNLKYGVHQVYFIASRGVSPVLDTDAHSITFDNVRDTFWKRYDVSVVATSNGNRAVTLDRVVTKLRLTFTDEVPATANSISIVPHTWYYGIDYLTGQPASVRTDAATVITIPDASKGQTGIQASLFGFSGADEWSTDVVISSRTPTDEILGSATIAAAPFKANRVSDYSGPLFSAGGSVTLSLNGEWITPYEGTW